MTRIGLATVAEADSMLTDLTSTDAGHGSLLYAFEISGDRSKRRVTHAWVAAPLKISVPCLSKCLRHQCNGSVKESVIRSVYTTHDPGRSMDPRKAQRKEALHKALQFKLDEFGATTITATV